MKTIGGLPVRDVLTTAAISAAGVGATTVVASALETRRPFAALDATSHILWGRSGFRANRFDLKHTGPSLLLNSWAMFQWSVLAHSLTRHTAEVSTTRAIATGAGVSAFAWVLDYVVLPKRLTPGVEARLSRTGTAAVFVALAASLAVGLKARATKRPVAGIG